MSIKENKDKGNFFVVFSQFLKGHTALMAWRREREREGERNWIGELGMRRVIS